MSFIIFEKASKFYNIQWTVFVVFTNSVKFLKKKTNNMISNEQSPIHTNNETTRHSDVCCTCVYVHYTSDVGVFVCVSEFVRV